MTGLLWGVLAASLVGSLHCAGMCGPLVIFCGGGERPRPTALGVYHLARLIGYTTLGLIAGTLGAAIDLGGEAAGFGRAAAVLAGVFMIVAGLGTFLGPRLAARRKSASGPGRVSTQLTRLMGRASKLDAFQRSLWIGALTALLPCGWLYAFLAAAAGTASPFKGALVMAAFWLGSVPILLGLGVGVGSLLGPLRKRAPAVVSVLLIGLGMFTVLGRFTVPSFAEALGPDAGERALRGELHSEEMPCCSGESSPTDAGLLPPDNPAEPCGCKHPGPCVKGVTCGCPGCGKE